MKKLRALGLTEKAVEIQRIQSTEVLAEMLAVLNMGGEDYVSRRTFGAHACGEFDESGAFDY